IPFASTAFPRVLRPGFQGLTPRTTSSDGTQTSSTTPLLPRPSVVRSGSCGPRRNRDPKFCGWKDAFHWMSAHVSPNTLRDAISWGSLAVLALHLARQIHFHAALIAGPQPAERCFWHSPLYRFLSSSWWHPRSWTENMKAGHHTEAFSYFQRAADRGYSKAQYNVGLCLEHGRGTPRDLGKAILFYHLAAIQGHSLAQYRYARCLLQSSASLSDPERQKAVSMLKQAADSGLREAQAFLGVLFTKEPNLDEQRAVKYLWLAASNGDSQSRFHLGVCYERGLGVQRNLVEAVKCYQQSAAVGNEPAQERLRILFNVKAAVHTVVLFANIIITRQVVRNPIIEKQSKDGKPVVEYQEEELLVREHCLSPSGASPLPPVSSEASPPCL
ncbi:Death ligand signal enhancer, partial [Microtus ochrogaster]